MLVPASVRRDTSLFELFSKPAQNQVDRLAGFGPDGASRNVHLSATSLRNRERERIHRPRFSQAGWRTEVLEPFPP
jgi:hypothetical protein